MLTITNSKYYDTLYTIEGKIMYLDSQVFFDLKRYSGLIDVVYKNNVQKINLVNLFYLKCFNFKRSDEDILRNLKHKISIFLSGISYLSDVGIPQDKQYYNSVKEESELYSVSGGNVTLDVGLATVLEEFGFYKRDYAEFLPNKKPSELLPDIVNRKIYEPYKTFRLDE